MKCEFDQQKVKSAAKILVWPSVSQSHGPLGSIRDTMGSSGQGELLVSYGHGGRKPRVFGIFASCKLMFQQCLKETHILECFNCKAHFAQYIAWYKNSISFFLVKCFLPEDWSVWRPLYSDAIYILLLPVHSLLYKFSTACTVALLYLFRLTVHFNCAPF